MNTRHPAAWRLLLATALLAVAAGCGGPADPADTHEEHEEHEEHDHDEHADHDEHDHDEPADGMVRLTANQIEAAGIRVETAGPATLREQLPLPGVIVPNAERVRDVTARFDGVLRSVARRPGDRVRAGENLATVESNESLQTYAVTAPIAGIVTARDANPGEQTGGRVLFTVADLATVWVEFALFPRDSARVRAGQQVRVRATGAGPVGEGEVAWVAPVGSAASQTLTARVLLDNRSGGWVPGRHVTVEVLLGDADVPVAVRNEALQTLDGQPVVFVAGQEGFTPATVRTGRQDDGQTEILAGLAPGSRYVADGSFILKAELGKGEATHEH